MPFSLGIASAHAQIVVNGSFELNDGNNSTTGPGWTFLGNVNYKNNEGASDGSFVAGYNGGNSGNGGVVYQTLTGLDIGARYHLTLDFGNFANDGPQQLTVEARDGAAYNSGAETIDPGSAAVVATSGGFIVTNGATVVVGDNSGAIGGGEFNQLSLDFVAQGLNATIVLTDSGNFTDRSDLVVDNVNVTAADLGNVPEPSTWAMMLGGLGLLGVVQRTRRSRRA